MPQLADASSPVAADPVERVSRIAHVLERSAARNEELRQLAPEVVDALHEQRLFRLLLPRAYGGEEIDLPTWFRTMEALAKLDASTAWCVGQINGCATTSSSLDPAVARRMWSEPRAVLSWGPPVKARAIEVDGGHRVSGEWMMASGSRHATWIGLMCNVLDARGDPVALPFGASMRVFFVPADTVTFIDNWDVIGLIATNSGGFRVDDAFVPHGYSVYLEHSLGAQLKNLSYRFALNTWFATGFSAVALGIARTMLDACEALATDKKPRMAKLALQENHMVQFQIGQAEARLRSARNFVESTVERTWKAASAAGEPTVEQRIGIRMATTFAIHEAKAAADAAWDVAGATAIFKSSAFERRRRDLSTLTQHLQGRHSHLQEVGAYFLGLEPNLRYA